MYLCMCVWERGSCELRRVIEPVRTECAAPLVTVSVTSYRRDTTTLVTLVPRATLGTLCTSDMVTVGKNPRPLSLSTANTSTQHLPSALTYLPPSSPTASALAQLLADALDAFDEPDRSRCALSAIAATTPPSTPQTSPPSRDHSTSPYQSAQATQHAQPPMMINEQQHAARSSASRMSSNSYSARGSLHTSPPSPPQSTATIMNRADPLVTTPSLLEQGGGICPITPQAAQAVPRHRAARSCPHTACLLLASNH